MNKQLLFLISLQELDILIKEKEKEEEMGFPIKPCEELKKAREKIIEKIDAHLMRRYERLSERYGNPVVPVVDGICQGCYMLLPTSLISQKAKNERIHTCPNCGRFLYWVDD
ncbi:hypothetical protein DRQ20_06055 [bacterium]|nr:MAG: hypothetical protein DRQ18_02360 [bacterium]RKZ24956.1 MAG: hypothetical protein DRQ20_06055 [bacterium]